VKEAKGKLAQRFGQGILLPRHGAPRLKILFGLRRLYFMPSPGDIFAEIEEYF
jgi:hypothetical protein